MVTITQPIVENTPYMDIQSVLKLKNGNYKATINGYKSNLIVDDGKYILDGQELFVSTTKVGYGERKWLICPNCSKNTKRLYLPPGANSWECRKCHELIYLTSRLSGNELDYIDYKIEKIQSRFDMSHSYCYGGLEGARHERIPLIKPKGMRWSEFHEIELELKLLINKRVDAWMKCLNMKR